MADETTYESEINQPAHRPGMESVVNRGPAQKMGVQNKPMPIMQARDQSGNETQDDRPKVAPGRTDPFSVAGDPAPKTPAKTPPSSPSADGSGSGGREREQVIMDNVDKASGG
jgi:hypothetical protein